MRAGSVNLNTPHEVNVQIYRTLGVIVFVSLMGIFWPEVDVMTARVFYLPDSQTFWGKSITVIYALHHSVPLISKALALLGISTLIYNSYIRPRADYFKRSLYFCLSYAAIPGIWINAILKDNWGRPRPSQTLFFGGEHPFYPAYVITGLSKQYGSFVSGHVALAMFVIAVGLFLDRSREALWLRVGFVYAAVMGFVRVSEGGHYLSDVLLGALMSLLGVLIAKRIYVRKSRSFS